MKIIYDFAEMFFNGLIGILTGIILLLGLLGFLYIVYYAFKSIKTKHITK
jgi:hypothetical protein